MTRATIILNRAGDRQRACNWIQQAPAGTRVEFKRTKRSIPQNSRLWAMLTDIAQQVKWHTVKLTPDDWKLVFMDALNREVRMVPNIDGTGFVNLGTRSSDLSIEEMGNLMELVSMFGAKHGVEFNEPGVINDTAHNATRRQEGPQEAGSTKEGS